MNDVFGRSVENINRGCEVNAIGRFIHWESKTGTNLAQEVERATWRTSMSRTAWPPRTTVLKAERTTVVAMMTREAVRAGVGTMSMVSHSVHSMATRSKSKGTRVMVAMRVGVEVVGSWRTVAVFALSTFAAEWTWSMVATAAALVLEMTVAVVVGAVRFGRGRFAIINSD